MKGALMLLPSAVAGGMCYWQLQRREWKAGVVAEARDAMRAPPQDIFTLDELPRFRRCSARGTYDHGRAVFVGPRPISFELSRAELSDPGVREMLSVPSAVKSGYLLIEPLTEGSSGRTILVNRGWVPPSWRQEWDSRYAAQQAPGDVAVAGTAQGSEDPSSFVPRNEPAKGSWFWLDVPGIASACGLHPATPLLQVLQDGGTQGESPRAPAGPFPLPKHSDAVVRFSTMPEDHTGYAVMWGGISASTAWLAVRLLRTGR